MRLPRFADQYDIYQYRVPLRLYIDVNFMCGYAATCSTTNHLNQYLARSCKALQRFENNIVVSPVRFRVLPPFNSNNLGGFRETTKNLSVPLLSLFSSSASSILSKVGQRPNSCYSLGHWFDPSPGSYFDNLARGARACHRVTYPSRALQRRGGHADSLLVRGMSVRGRLSDSKCLARTLLATCPNKHLSESSLTPVSDFIT
jgi:hypothetical protein